MRGLYYLTQPGSAHGQVEAGLGAGEADGVTGGGRGGGHVKPEAVLVMTRDQVETLTLPNCGLRPKMTCKDYLMRHKAFKTYSDRNNCIYEFNSLINNDLVNRKILNLFIKKYVICNVVKFRGCDL